MSRVITFSMQFPKYHPKSGEPTFFVEKILNGIMPKQQNGVIDLNTLPEGVNGIVNDFVLLRSPEDIKGHTIRAGNRWKVGDKFSPRVWSGKPYASKQISIAPDIEIKYCPTFEICNVGTKKDPDNILCIDGHRLGVQEVQELAMNDGLSFMDLMNWFKFPKPFKGQVICWQQNINY